MKTAERFIKKQVTVEAIQFNGNSNRAGIELFVGKELKTELESETAYIAGHGAPIFSLLIETKEGVMKAFKNDWIIKEPFPTGDRDFYPCKSDIFEKTYSPLASHPSPMSAEQVEDKDLIIQGLQEGAESWKAEYDNCRALLQELVSLKVMKENLYKGNPDGKEYAERKPKAWQAAQQFLLTYQHEGFATTPSVKADGWVNIYEDIQGRYIGDSEYSSYQEAFDERDELSTYLETVQISRLPAPPKQQL